MRSIPGAAVVLVAALFAPGSGRANGVPELVNTMWQVDGTVAVQITVKGAGSYKANGAFTDQPCDIWVDETGGQAFFGMQNLDFPALAPDDTLAMAFLPLDPISVKPTRIKAGIVDANNRSSVAQSVVSIYNTLAAGGMVSVLGDHKRSKSVPREDLGDFTLDPAVVKASATYKAPKDISSLKVAATVEFSGVLTGGPNSGKAIKGKIAIRATGLPSVPVKR